MFTLKAKRGAARLGELTTAHGSIQTPCFMPIATRGSVKFLSNRDFADIGNQIILANAYHLYLRPGLEVLRSVGGLHKLMNWSKPLLTDSGGYQVFSLAHLNKVTADGVTFRSPLDGSSCFFTPELSMEIQAAVGSDIWMCFDYFTGYPATEQQTKEAVERTTAWAKRCYHWWTEYCRKLEPAASPLLFGIVQGASFPEWRKSSCHALGALPLTGYAVGGLAVGEPIEVMYQMLEVTLPELPADKPRYLMGVGQPEQILAAVKYGVDMFDCVLPTRNARHGQVYLHTAAPLVPSDLSTVNYQRVHLTIKEFTIDQRPLDPYCHCPTCTSGYSRAYLRHLFRVGEPLGQYLATVHNVYFYIELLRSIRYAIPNQPSAN